MFVSYVNSYTFDFLQILPILLKCKCVCTRYELKLGPTLPSGWNHKCGHWSGSLVNLDMMEKGRVNHLTNSSCVFLWNCLCALKLHMHVDICLCLQCY